MKAGHATLGTNITLSVCLRRCTGSFLCPSVYKVTAVWVCRHNCRQRGAGMLSMAHGMCHVLRKTCQTPSISLAHFLVHLPGCPWMWKCVSSVLSLFLTCHLLAHLLDWLFINKVTMAAMCVHAYLSAVLGKGVKNEAIEKHGWGMTSWWLCHWHSKNLIIYSPLKLTVTTVSQVWYKGSLLLLWQWASPLTILMRCWQC